MLDEADRHVDFHRRERSPRTPAGAYPIEFIRNAKIPCIGGPPDRRDLPDLRRLRRAAAGQPAPPEQAMYHFISGYTAKVAGTEVGVNEPQATFSPCFGGPFLVWHPTRYAELLAEKIREHRAHVWLVNTGWSGGSVRRRAIA